MQTRVQGDFSFFPPHAMMPQHAEEEVPGEEEEEIRPSNDNNTFPPR